MKAALHSQACFVCTAGPVNMWALVFSLDISMGGGYDPSFTPPPHLPPPISKTVGAVVNQDTDPI